MGAAASIRMVYKDAMNWFRTYIDGDTYIADFAAIDKDGDNTLSYMEVKNWIERKAKEDPNWGVFLADGAPIIAVAHKMASMRSGPHSHVIAPKVVDVNDFKTLLIQMFAIAILWSHFDNADQWKDGEDPGSKELSFDAFRLAVRTLTLANAKEELSDEELLEDFHIIDTNSSGTIGFHEVCNFCCKFIDDPQTVEKKIVDAEARRVSVSTVTIPKFFGENIGDGAKVGIVNEINQKKHKGPKAYTDGLTVDDKNKEALSMLAYKIERQTSTARKVASEEKALVIKKRFSTIESMVENNLCCGYLLKFCQREFTAENLLFIMEVDDYRDFFVGDIKETTDAEGNSGPAVSCWANKWQDTDLTVNIDQPPDPSLLDSDYWPSATDRTQAKTVCDTLFANFLSNDSQVQVCISESFMEKTLRRMQLLHLYGPQVFEEAVIDPIKTMKKDVLPRFVVSDICQELFNHLALCEPLPSENLLEVVAPSDDEVLKVSTGNETSEGGKPFSADTTKKKAPADLQLNDAIHSKSFYTAFEKFLVEKDPSIPISSSSEVASRASRASRGSFGNNQNNNKSFRVIQHLYCLRLIARIEGETAISINPATSNVDKIVAVSEAVEEAWDLYKFYVAPGSCYEVTDLPYGERKKFMLEVAKPTIDNKGMATMKLSATNHLFPLFAAFRATDEFKAVCKSVLGAVP